MLWIYPKLVKTTRILGDTIVVAVCCWFSLSGIIFVASLVGVLLLFSHSCILNAIDMSKNITMKRTLSVQFIF